MKLRFRFHDEVGARNLILPLEGTPPDEDDWETWFYDEVMPLMQAEGLEEVYGVHDLSMNPEEELLAFSSGEVDDWDGLLNDWRDILTSLGFEVGELEVEEGVEE